MQAESGRMMASRQRLYPAIVIGLWLFVAAVDAAALLWRTDVTRAMALTLVYGVPLVLLTTFRRKLPVWKCVSMVAGAVVMQMAFVILVSRSH
ncbi:MAG: hypothetical protein QOJ65_1105 [Fimbriimonadaceae bacterium]|nr:hypothetical protein [Fimbriimonadaceae bacterium]